MKPSKTVTSVLHCAALVAFAAMIVLTAATADTIIKWDFDTPIAGTNPPPGGATPVFPYSTIVGPSTGTGSISIAGATPPLTVDPPSPYAGPVGKTWYFSGQPGLALNIAPLAYLPTPANPISSVDNPTEGTSYIQFNTSTSGWQDIAVSFDIRATGTSPNKARLKYTTDGTTWTDFVDPVLGNPFTINTVASQWKNFTFNLSTISGANDNANFGIQVAAAADASVSNYKGVSSTIGTGGYWRFDNITISGNTLGSTGPTPTITGPSANATILDPVSYTVMFSEPVNGFNSSSDVSVETTGTASVDPPVIAGTSGTAGPYTVTLTPAGGTGSVKITIPQNVCNAVSGGSPNKSSTPSAAFSIVNEPLATWNGSPSTSLTKAGPVTFNVNFNVPVTDFKTADDIIVEVMDGTVTVGSIVVAGNTDPAPFIGPYTVTVSNITGNGLFRLKVKANAAYNNGIGNLESFGSSNIRVIQPGAVLSKWIFDSVVPDANVTTGTTVPIIGSGTAVLGPSLTATYATGIPNAGVNLDNSGWNSVPFAGIPLGIGDPPISPTNPLPKTRYVQYSVNTTGYTDIVVVWDQQYSSTSPNTTVLQYTTNGTTWADANTFKASSATQYTRVVTLPADAGGKANFAVRMAADVDATALDYKPADASATIGNGGTWRFDNVTFYGSIPIGGDAPIGSLKGLSNGDPVSLCNKALYLKRNGWGYVEEQHRASGIRIEGPIVGNEGDLVCLTGSIGTTAGGEKFVQLDQMSQGSPFSPNPLGATSTAIKTSMMDGLFVKAWGNVVFGSKTSNSYVINDGADALGIKVITEGTPAVNEGDFDVVTGAAGWEGARVIYKK